MTFHYKHVTAVLRHKCDGGAVVNSMEMLLSNIGEEAQHPMPAPFFHYLVFTCHPYPEKELYGHVT